MHKAACCLCVVWSMYEKERPQPNHYTYQLNQNGKKGKLNIFYLLVTNLQCQMYLFTVHMFDSFFLFFLRCFLSLSRIFSTLMMHVVMTGFCVGMKYGWWLYFSTSHVWNYVSLKTWINAKKKLSVCPCWQR